MREPSHRTWPHLVIIAGLSLVLGACSASQPSAEVSPSASLDSVGSSVGPTTDSPEPSGEVPSPTPPSGVLPPDSIARVVVDTLNLREEPGARSPLVGQLHRGDLVFVWGIAQEFEGRIWYRVEGPFDTWAGLVALEATPGLLSGSVAGGDSGIPYLQLEPVNCPTAQPSFDNILLMTAWERLACFGNRDVTLTNTVDAPCCNPPDGYVYEPFWLAKEIPGVVLGRLDTGEGVLVFRINPASGLVPPARGQVVALTGHFDDPAASSCRARPEVSDEAGRYPLVAEAMVLWCRMQFVATRYQVIGIESMPPGP